MDDDLVARLNALKGGAPRAPPAQETGHAAQAAVDEDAALAAIAGAPAGDDDDELEALLASLGGGDGEVEPTLDDLSRRDLSPAELERQAAALLAEAGRALPEVPAEDPDRRSDPVAESGADGSLAALIEFRKPPASPPAGDAQSRRNDVDARARANVNDDDDGEGGTAATTLEALLAEAALEDAHDKSPSDARTSVRGASGRGGGGGCERSERSEEREGDGHGEGDGNGAPGRSAGPAAPAALDLPSVADLPSLPVLDDTPVDGADAARMAALMGLRGPSTFPTTPRRDPKPAPKPQRKPGQGWGIPGYEDGRDDDIESWCSICNADAALRCLGCDGDLYCAQCWREGHGPGGEQGHKAVKFAWHRKA